MPPKKVQLIASRGPLDITQFTAMDATECTVSGCTAVGTVLENGHITSIYRNDVPAFHELLLYDQEPHAANILRARTVRKSLAKATFKADTFNYSSYLDVKPWTYKESSRLRRRFQPEDRSEYPTLGIQTSAQYFFDSAEEGQRTPCILLTLEEQIKGRIRVKVLYSACSFLHEKIAILSGVVQLPKAPIVHHSQPQLRTMARR